jgi:hypothetical protein
LHRFDQHTDRALPDRPYVFDSLERAFVQLAGLAPGNVGGCLFWLAR